MTLDETINTVQSILIQLQRLKQLEEKEKYRRKNYPELFLVWQAMRNRCYNPKDDSYIHYGKRGIKVCDEWNNSSTEFISWAVKNGYEKGLQIDRINNNEDYYPENCRFVTAKTNSRNRTNTKYLTLNGETKCVAEWCEIYNIEKPRKVYRWIERNGKQYAERRFKEMIGVIT